MVNQEKTDKDHQAKTSVNSEVTESGSILPDISKRHDKLFKGIMSQEEVAKEFFRVHLPEKIKNLVELDTLVPDKTDFVDEKLKETLSDTIFKVNLRESSEITYMCVLLEHQSKHDPLMSFRIVKYMVAIWDGYLNANNEAKKLPMIYPFIFSNAEHPNKMSLSLFDLFEDGDLQREFLIGSYDMVDVNSIPDDQILSNTLIGAMEYTLKHGREDNVLEQLDKLKEILQEIIRTKKVKGIDYIRRILWYNISKISKESKGKLEKVLLDVTKEKVNIEDIMGSLAEEWYSEGIGIGKAEGIGIGKAEGIGIGEHNKAVETAKNMLSKNLDLKLISDCTGLSESEIIDLQKQKSS